MKKNMLRSSLTYSLLTTGITLTMATSGVAILRALKSDDNIQYTPNEIALAALLGETASCFIECSLSIYFSNLEKKLNPLSFRLFLASSKWLSDSLEGVRPEILGAALYITSFMIFYCIKSSFNIMLGKYLLEDTNGANFFKIFNVLSIGATIASPLLWGYFIYYSLETMNNYVRCSLQRYCRTTFFSEAPTATVSTTTQHLLITTALTAASACLGATVLNADEDHKASLMAVLLASVTGQTLVNLTYFASTYLISRDDEPYYTLHDQINHNRKSFYGSLFQSVLPFIGCLLSMLLGQPLIYALNLDEGLSLSESISSGATGSAILLPFIFIYSFINFYRYHSETHEDTDRLVDAVEDLTLTTPYELHLDTEDNNHHGDIESGTASFWSDVGESMAATETTETPPLQ